MQLLKAKKFNAFALIKYTFYYIGVILMVLPMLFASCSSSDDDEFTPSAGGSDTAGQIIGSDGERLYISSVGTDAIFSYDSEGRISKCRTNGHDDYMFSYNPFKISYTYTGSSYSDVVEYYDIALNSKGYIVSMKSRSESISSTNQDYNETTDGVVRFSYDSNGHLTKMVGTGSGVSYEDGEKVTEKYSLEYTLTWANGKLTKIVCNGNEDGEKYTDTATFEYGDNTYPNVTKQWTVNNMADMMDGEIEFLFYAGYLGVAGDYHPVSAVQNDSDGDTSTFAYSYDFNANGSVKASKSKYNGSSYWNTKNFTYISK